MRCGFNKHREATSKSHERETKDPVSSIDFRPNAPLVRALKSLELLVVEGERPASQQLNL